MAVAPIALALAVPPRLESYDLSSLRYIMWGATPVTPSVAEAVTRRTGVGWLPAYGASELPVIACNPLDRPRLDSAGRAVPGVALRVVSLETGKPAEPGEAGEIQARAGVADGRATSRPRPRRRPSATAGTAPATSAPSTPAAGCGSPTGPRK